MNKFKKTFYIFPTLCVFILNGCVGDNSSNPNGNNPQTGPVKGDSISTQANNTLPTTTEIALSVPPCTNHSCTPIWSLEKDFAQINLSFVHPGIHCDGTVLGKISESSGQRVLTLTDKGHRNTCYARIENVFRSNPNHVYLEATIQVSAPEGANPNQIWPAFWTSGEPWPTNAEIDIAEGNVNSGFARLETWTNLHGRNGANQGPSLKYNSSKLTDFGQPHTYGLELLKNPATKHIEITTYVDGVQMTYFNNANASGADAQDYQDLINGFYSHAIVIDIDDNNAPVKYQMDVTNLNAYIVN
ncbi:MAG: hypothetical protein K0R14_1453 [Burkholderiales bacterium]|jgi:hypothetical protein|nr:hypothetical protein [Burkholderiales bacterium]